MDRLHPTGEPVGPDRGVAAEAYGTRDGQRISLSLQLPRDRGSVPVIRHLARQALTEMGVTESVTYEVQLALSEACANVLDHAGEGDSYEVSMNITATSCELRITDTGRGLDHDPIIDERAGPEDVRGRGVSIMRALMDGVHFASEPEHGTLVTLTKRLEFDHSSPGGILFVEEIEGERRER